MMYSVLLVFVFLRFYMQPIAINVLCINATCDWPTVTAAATGTVCGSVKLSVVMNVECVLFVKIVGIGYEWW